jgi:hypothetical protein
MCRTAIDLDVIGTTKMRTLLTFSACMSHRNRRDRLLAAVESVFAHNKRSLVGECLVVNEFDENRQEDFAPLVLGKEPTIQFIQKSKQDRGQARTLNMILDRLQWYDLWIHWEEMWMCVRPFIEESIEIMRQQPDLTQLQVAYKPEPSWTPDRRIAKTTSGGLPYEQILIGKDAERMRSAKREDWAHLEWPLFSLMPGVNRAQFCRRVVGRFSEDAALWPVTFEFEYGLRWLLRGGIKGISVPHAAERQPGASTYAV